VLRTAPLTGGEVVTAFVAGPPLQSASSLSRLQGDPSLVREQTFNFRSQSAGEEKLDVDSSQLLGSLRLARSRRESGGVAVR